MDASSARITVDPIVGLHVRGLAVASLALFFIALGICMRARGERRGSGRRGGRAQAESAKEVTPAGIAFGLLLHGASSPRRICSGFSGWQSEGLGLDLYEHAPEHAYAAIEIGAFRAFEVGEEATHPWSAMVLEQLASAPAGAGGAPSGAPRQDLAEDLGVILRFRLPLGALDPKPAQICAEPRQGALVQETAQVIGAIRKQLAAAEPDEEIEIFPLDPLKAGAARRLGKRGVRQPERTGVAAQFRKPRKKRGIPRAREQVRGERILLRA